MYKEFPYLFSKNANLDFREVNLKFKFMAYIKGELFACLRLHFYGYQMRYMWVVINHQKGGD
jgi:hypothetical protein